MIIQGQSDKKITQLNGMGEGKDLAILANGPSLNEAPIEELMDKPKIDLLTVNIPDERAWPTKFWMMTDMNIYYRCQNYFKEFKGFLLANHIEKRSAPKNMIRLRIHRQRGFSRDLLWGVHQGVSTTYMAIQAALAMGFNRIFIFGLDMSEDKKTGEMYHYGENPFIKKDNRLERFDMDAEYWGRAVEEEMTEEEIERIYICSELNPYGFAEVIGKVSPKEGVEILLNGNSRS